MVLANWNDVFSRIKDIEDVSPSVRHLTTEAIC